MRVSGLSWVEWKTPWSSSIDKHIGTVQQLKAHLKEVLDEERQLLQEGELPCKVRALSCAEAMSRECPAPQLKRKTFKSLGTPTVQADELSSDRSMLSREELLAAAERRYFACVCS